MDAIIVLLILAIISISTILSNIFDSILVSSVNYIFLTAIILEYASYDSSLATITRVSGLLNQMPFNYSSWGTVVSLTVRTKLRLALGTEIPMRIGLLITRTMVLAIPILLIESFIANLAISYNLFIVMLLCIPVRIFEMFYLTVQIYIINEVIEALLSSDLQ
jgi:hypothetical protein